MKSFKIFLILLLIPFTELLKFIASKNADMVETLYSKGIYPFIVKILSNISGIFPFSLMEIFLIGIVIYFIYRIIHVLASIKHKKLKEEGFKLLKIVVLFVSIAYFLFIALWSLNNYRLDVADIFDLQESTISSEELVELYEHVIIKTNGLREQIKENNMGIADEHTVWHITNNAQDSYKSLAGVYPIFGGTYGRPKQLTFSFLQTSAGYSGIYFPFTGEPNINKQVPIFSIPHIVCHEIAHQRGFASEDAANYVGFLACKYSDDLFFQYSGYMFILSNIRNTVYNHSTQIGKDMDMLLSEGVKRDLNYKRDFWSKKVNEQLSEIADKANNAYLKSNNQEEGILNYGKVIELIIADYVKNGTI